MIERAPALRLVATSWISGWWLRDRRTNGHSPAVRQAGYQVEEIRFVADDGSKAGGFAVDALRDLTGGRMTSVARSELAAEIYRSLDGRVETTFDDEISAINEHDDSAQIVLQSGKKRDVDIVVGADGLRSRVRELIFGTEGRFEKDLGYRFAVFETAGYETRDENVYVIHAAASRQIARFALRGGRTLFLLVFRAELLNGVEPIGPVETRAVMKTVFGDAGWESGRILAAMETADDLYFDRVSQIRMPTWHRGRTVLVGDAGMAVSFLAGEGAGLAMMGAYVLAGEILRAPGDYAKAFATYDARLRPFIEAKQHRAESFASTFVPQTEFGIWLRNQATKLMALPGAANLMLGKSLSDDFTLPDYA
ncbi:MAG: FAD-dependent monooxygenase [Dongiaceae bacterium]